MRASFNGSSMNVVERSRVIVQRFVVSDKLVQSPSCPTLAFITKSDEKEKNELKMWRHGSNKLPK